MVGAHPSMPDTFDGYGILAQAELRGVREMLWSRGTITGTSVRREERDVGLPLNKPEGLTRRIRPSLAASFFVSPFIAERRGKKGRGEARYCINSGGRCGGMALPTTITVLLFLHPF